VVKYEKQLASFLRKRRGEMSLAQFGRVLGLTKGAVHNLEAASVSARLCTLQQICIRLKCKLTDIFPET
jgi:DNA-binding Xre family transcriptional regulator